MITKLIISFFQCHAAFTPEKGNFGRGSEEQEPQECQNGT